MTAPATGVPAPRRPWSALALTVLMPTIGSAAAFGWWPGPFGTGIYWTAKLWAMTLPLWWTVWVDGLAWSWSPVRRGGFGLATGLGFVMGGAIWIAFWLGGDYLIDPAGLRAVVEPAGLTSKSIFIGGALFWIFVNSVLEEYLFRWFIYRQFAARLSRGAAILAAAAAFTAHHTVVLALQFGAGAAILGTIGCFAGAAIWSWLYARTESVWPCWVSHAIVDVAIFILGWMLIFEW
jgi:membrane protease YdiL (CAAX protease family)